jgi:type VI secretion system secreted protein VgrG
VLLTAQGACLKLEGGNIELHGPGKIEFKATMKELAGPASSSFHMPSLPKTDQPVSFDKPVFSQQFDLSHLALNDGLAFSSKRLPYTVYDKTGKFVALGITDENGLTNRIFTNEQTELVLLAGDGQWQVEEYFESDDWNDNKFDNMG